MSRKSGFTAIFNDHAVSGFAIAAATAVAGGVAMTFGATGNTVGAAVSGGLAAALACLNGLAFGSAQAIMASQAKELEALRAAGAKPSAPALSNP